MRTGSVPGFRIVFAALAVSLAGGAAAQSSGGEFRGVWITPEPQASRTPVTFSFHREELGSGRMSVRLGEGGRRFVGTYLRLTPAHGESRVRVFFSHWTSDAFDQYQYGPMGASLVRTKITITEWRNRYSGRVVAKLQAADGGAMRCLFELRETAKGLAGGANGACQLANGETIEIAGQR